MPRSKTDLFRHPVWVPLFALTAAVLWGWAYPLIKMGFAEFQIRPEMMGAKMLFAGIRFCLSGLIILIVAACTGRRFGVRRGPDLTYVLLFALVNTTLHYTFFYFGLAYSEGARAAILNSTGVFLLVILACIFFESDRFTTGKWVGCALGFGGILILNPGGNLGGNNSLTGDSMIVLNALCSAIAGLMTRGLSKRVDIFVGTGYSLALGGALLLIPGLVTGGTLPRISPDGLLILLMLVVISTLGFTLFNKLISCNPVGKVAIFNSLIPVVGAVTSCLCLAEPFYWKYVIAGSLAATGIYVINREKNRNSSSRERNYLPKRCTSLRSPIFFPHERKTFSSLGKNKSTTRPNPECHSQAF